MNSFVKKLNRSVVCDTAFCCCLFICVLLLVYKAFHSIGDEDEALFIMNAFRFVKGDRMLVDDWHVSQLCSVFLYIPFKLFYTIVGSCEGIVIFSRILFVVAQSAMSVLTYLSLRKYGYSSVVSGILYMFHIPVIFLMVLYYNSLLCIFVQLCALLILSADKAFSLGKMFLLGVLYAMAVICSPYCLLIFVAYVIASIANIALKKKKTLSEPLNKFFTFKSLLCICCGVLVSAIALSFFILKGNSIGEIFKNLPMVFLDNEYSSGALDGFFKAFTGIYTDIVFLCRTVSMPSFIFGVIILTLVAFDKKRMVHRNFYLTLTVGWYILFVMSVYFSNELISRISDVWALMFVGLICYVLTKEKNRRLFYIFFVGGFATAALRALESEMNIIAGFSVMPVCVSGAAVIIALTAREIYSDKKSEKNVYLKAVKPKKSNRAVATALIAVLAIQVGFQIYCNMYKGMYTEYCYGSSDTSEELNVELTKGPMKYVRTTTDVADIYNKTLADLDYIRENASGAFMLPIETDWIYLYLDELDIGTYSGYLVDEDWVDFCSKKMNLYYEYHPKRYPEYIYVPYYNHRLSYDNTIQQDIYNNISTGFNCTVKYGNAGYILRTAAIGSNTDGVGYLN